MADLHEQEGSAEDINDDGNFKIRIPNPKVYMARQSLWIGRRGKPRCDHCRVNNLKKCDRVLPACNHCSWTAGRECKYTPLPTPAHRGIPRCDRCRLKNLKCDRNLPVCNHCNDDQKVECNYTPKKRHKPMPTPDPIGLKTMPYLMPDNDVSSEERYNNMHAKQHITYDHKMASTSSRTLGDSPSPVSFDAEGSPGSESSRRMQTGRFTADMSFTSRSNESLAMISPSRPYIDNHLLSLSQHTRISQRQGINSPHIEPWAHPSFAPLPDFITRRLRLINSAEVPNPSVFSQSLSNFLEGLMVEHRETACLVPDVYAMVARSLGGGEAPEISTRIHEWCALHHLCRGSNKYNLILVPRESIYCTDDNQKESYRLEYCARVDNGGDLTLGATYHKQLPEEPLDSLANVFQRLPVRSQIYDILTYAHRSHDNSYTMVEDIQNLGFAFITWPMAELYTRLCPLCIFHNRQAGSHVINTEG